MRVRSENGNGGEARIKRPEARPRQKVQIDETFKPCPEVGMKFCEWADTDWSGRPVCLAIISVCDEAIAAPETERRVSRGH